ncbi:1-deoxy-D-xylulose-5-phosphate synthase [Streptomyces griseochromogenes]|uniref:1-deoxy-D-xylulose-5-phosphate synthase n=1 Tax=Streptomyces griseochromogenes TaxID=68214 RepID=UPI00378C4BF5
MAHSSDVPVECVPQSWSPSYGDAVELDAFCSRKGHALAAQGGIESDFGLDLTSLDPADVRALDRSGCKRLAKEIREFLIENVTRSGGHLGANLGVVELTIAVHRAFDSPSDAIIFDIGHQAYTHKILTGRGGAFDTFRERKGMSGFPARGESPHDRVENSHSSTGPAWALGIALADGTRPVVVIGDGALTGGVAYEALNNIGVRQLPVVIVYNDNGRSYARTTSRLTLGEPCESEATGSRNVEQFFTALGFSYVGPANGHDFDDLEPAIERAAAADGPVVVHVRTQKGFGWSDAERDEIMRLHQVGGTVAAPPAQELPLATGPQAWGQELSDILCELAEQDPRVHVITAAMPDLLCLLEFRRRFPDRYHDVGICEQAAVGLAAGLASQGCRPVFAVFATFLTRGMDQIINDVALHELPVTFVVDRGGVAGGDGASSHGIYDVGLLRMVPGLDIYAPTSGDQLSAVLRSAIGRDSGPTVVRYAKWKPLRSDPDGTSVESVLRRRGSDLCLLAHGAMVQTAVAAADVMEREHGVSATVWEVVRLRPAVTDVFADAARHKAVVTIEDLAEGSGLYPDLLTHLARGRGTVPATAQVALPAGFLPWGIREELLAEFGVSTEAVVRHAEELLGLEPTEGSDAEAR